MGLLRSTDSIELDFAIGEGRAILTHNVADFPRLGAELQTQEKPFLGIILSTRESRGEMLRRTLKLLSSETPESLKDRVVWLSDYR